MQDILYRSNPWWEENYSFEGITRNIYLNEMKLVFENPDIVFLTGLRRVGKTTLMKSFISHLINHKKIEPQQIFYISLDLLALSDLSIQDILKEYRTLLKLSNSTKTYLFFDEVTAKKDYHQELKNLYDLESVKIYASSSSASLLKDKNAYLTGRQRVLEIMPLSFEEYLNFKKIKIKKSESYLLKSYFEDYMQSGGMPEFVKTKDISYLQNLIDNIIYKDIIAHNNIKNEQTIRDFYKLLMERSGKQLSLNKIANILDIGADSARRYLSYFEETYLIYTVKKYGKLNERIKNPKKIYSADIGLKNVVTGFRDLGAVFENMVYLKIKSQNPRYVYENGIELDFMTENKTLIEVKYNSKLNKNQEKLYEKIEANKKIRIQNIEDFLKFL
ncbi:MAG: AAA family ATPase [uncultured Campylobacterales bacterium]|uniref:AAA family ATPase n=1 Tax=uncultured Campylobacterales bacterium TaxID=352960 RepID=A0A6S6TE33_9BACT|nr:MAG: AAA family ATPase [uncultured Campylobacterales bacterium]